jgi:hypothetical protein
MKKQVNNMKICKRKEGFFIKKQKVCLINFIGKKRHIQKEFKHA